MESLQKHCEQIGDPYKILSISHETIVGEEERNKKKCVKCDKTAKYFCNFIGTEKILCEEHALIFKRKNSSLPADMWFCKPI